MVAEYYGATKGSVLVSVEVSGRDQRFKRFEVWRRIRSWCIQNADAPPIRKNVDFKRITTAVEAPLNLGVFYSSGETKEFQCFLLNFIQSRPDI